MKRPVLLAQAVQSLVQGFRWEPIGKKAAVAVLFMGLIWKGSIRYSELQTRNMMLSQADTFAGVKRLKPSSSTSSKSSRKTAAWRVALVARAMPRGR